MNILTTKTASAALILAFGLAGATPGLTEDRPEHYEGEEAETLEEAVLNFKEYNAKLEEVMQKSELSDNDITEIHRWTYTLENALETIREELPDLAEKLENLHLASEVYDGEVTKERGEIYLDSAKAWNQ